MGKHIQLHSNNAMPPQNESQQHLKMKREIKHSLIPHLGHKPIRERVEVM